MGLAGKTTRIFKTSRGENEYAAVTSMGVIFLNYNNETKQFSENLNETYFDKRHILDAYEFKNDKILATIFGDKNIYLIDRKTKT